MKAPKTSWKQKVAAAREPKRVTLEADFAGLPAGEIKRNQPVWAATSVPLWQGSKNHGLWLALTQSDSATASVHTAPAAPTPDSPVPARAPLPAASGDWPAADVRS